jgi:hypothetical protein
VPETTDLHPAHAANKLRQAQRLAAHLRSIGLDDPAVIAWLTDDRRARIARAAGETHTPSRSTWAMVVVLLETPAPAAVALDGTEFAGLHR